MKKIIFHLGSFILYLFLFAACSSPKMVSCPDYSSDRSVQASHLKHYQPVKYKAPRQTNKPIHLKNLAQKDQICIKEQETDITEVEPRLAFLDVNEPSGVKNLHVNQELSFKQPIRLQDMNGVIEKYKVTASTEGIKESGVRNLSPKNEVTEISDAKIQNAFINPIVNNSITKESRITVRDKIRHLRNSLKSLMKSKPIIGLAVASLTCSLIGLLIFGMPLGILAVIFGSTALARSRGNSIQTGKGIAIAGLVVGIVDIVAVALFLASM